MTSARRFMHDVRREMRSNKARIGETNPMARLDERAVLDIRLQRMTYKEYARKYRVKIGTISDIICGRTWRHLYDHEQ